MDSATPHQEPSPGKRPFVPHGVDAGSWLGFEQRIQERRFHALLETARAARAAGDRDAAHNALAEARTLRPHAAELDAFAQLPTRTPVASRRHRASGAVALLAAGIGFLLAVDGFRYPTVTSVPTPPPVHVLMTERPVAAATTGALDEARPAERADPPAVERGRVAIEEVAVPVARERQPVAPPPLPSYVARTSAIPVERERDAAPPAVPPTRPAAVEAEAVSASAIASASAAVPAIGPVDESRVTATLERYAKAYTELDARAARSVWPSVNERALSNAFAGLAAQSLDFQDCEVVVRQVEADAVCRGTTSYVTRVGSSNPRVEPRTWHFELSRHGDDWLIDTAVARR